MAIVWRTYGDREKCWDLFRFEMIGVLMVMLWLNLKCWDAHALKSGAIPMLRIPSILRIKCILGMLLNLSTLRRRVKASRQGVASRRFRTQKLENPNPYEYATAGCPEVCKFQCFKHVRNYINATSLWVRQGARARWDLIFCTSL